MDEKNKRFVHFETNKITIYEVQNKQIIKIKEDVLYFNETLVNNELYNKIDKYLYNLNKENTFNTKNLRLCATGIFQEFSLNEQIQLTIHIFVKHGIYFNIINKELEQFYLNQEIDNKKVSNIIEGIWKQEFRKVVICGSFQKNMVEICKLMDKLKQHNVEILSPWTKDVVQETTGTDFILLEDQTNEPKDISIMFSYEIGLNNIE